MSEAPQFQSQRKAGEVIAGRYRLVRALGEGAFGEVWLTEGTADGAHVVVKILHAQWARVPQVVERFRREAVATTRVSHANVCRIYEYALTSDEIPFITMEFLTGGTLKQELARSGPMPLGRVSDLMAPVCEAVAAAHHVGIVHRDLKPDNVMLTHRAGQEVPVVLDFGIAKLLDATEKLTQTGSMLGTPAYMSPEQCQGKSDIGPGADVYALAIMIFELLVARPPFTSRTLAEMAMKHVLEPPPKLAGVPPGLAEVIDRALAKDPKDRPNAAVLAGALREAARTSPNALASSIDTPDEQKLNPSGPIGRNAAAAAAPRSGGARATGAAPSDKAQGGPRVAVDAHSAATMISAGGAEIEARTQELLRKARESQTSMRPLPAGTVKVQAPAKSPPTILYVVGVAVLGLIGALIGLLLR